MAYDDPHYLVHLLKGWRCSPLLLRRVRLFHALVSGCRYCAQQLTCCPPMDRFVHAEEIPRYWMHFSLLTPGKAKFTCTCPPEEHCNYSWYFRAPRVSLEPSNPLVCRAPDLPDEFYAPPSELFPTDANLNRNRR